VQWVLRAQYVEGVCFCVISASRAQREKKLFVFAARYQTKKNNYEHRPAQ
jgi:hypothetical protein